MQSSLSPLEIVERIAAEFGQQGREQQSHVSGFAMPALPARIVADSKAIAQLLRLLAQYGLEQVKDQKDGAILIEALLEKNVGTDRIRFGVTYSKQEVSAPEAEHIRRRLLSESIDGKRCEQILAELNTSLLVDQELLGRGVRFCFPIEVVHDKADQSQDIYAEALRDIKMFLVSNDPPPNRVMQQYARHAGIYLEGAPTASEMIIELARRGQDFEVVAIAPPIEDMSPIELAKTIRQSRCSHLKLLYVAAWDDPADRLAHMNAGFDETIAKPFTKKQLFDAFAKLAGRTLKTEKSPKVVLIAEDNPINAQLAHFQLRKLGYESEIVHNGKEAVEAVTNGSYLAVFMDLQMPVLPGIEAIKQIRDLERQRNSQRMPIIALTANTHLEPEAKQSGCDYFLAKPARIADLQRALQHCVGDQGFPGADQRTPARP